LKYKQSNGGEQGLYQDFHLETAIKASEAARDRFFVVSVVPAGAAQPAAQPQSQAPVQAAAPVSKPPVDNKRVSMNVGSPAPANSSAFSRLSEQLKEFESAQNQPQAPSQAKDASSGKLKFCPNCGAQASSGKFCTECGTPYPLATQAELAPVATPVSKVQESSDARRKRMSFHPGAAAKIASCAACSNPLGVDSVNALDKQWHKECFVCKGCKKSLVTEGFKNSEGFPMCVDCFNDKFGMKCTGCRKAITAAYVQVKGQPWHGDCFVCNRCKKPFDAEFGEKDGEFLCSNCINFY